MYFRPFFVAVTTARGIVNGWSRKDIGDLRCSPGSAGTHLRSTGAHQSAYRTTSRRYYLPREEHHFLFSAGDLHPSEHSAFPGAICDRKTQALAALGT